MFFWKDPGKEFDEKLARMSREELEEELVSTMEFESIYTKYQVCISELMKAKQNNEIYFPKERINTLNRPEIGADFNDLHWELICKLKDELTTAVKLAGFTVEDGECYRIPIERNCDENNKAKLVRYLAYKGQKYLIGDHVRVKEYWKEEFTGCICSMTENEFIPGIYIKSDKGKIIHIFIENIEKLSLTDKSKGQPK